MEYVYSWNGEDDWEFDVGEVHTQILDAGEPEGKYTIYRGLANKPNILNYFDVDTFIELISNNIYEEYDEVAEDFINRIQQDTDDLENDLLYAFRKHMEKHGAEVNFYSVSNINRIEIDVKEEQ